MKNTKKDLIQFFTWLRNGIAFSVTWFLVLKLIYNRMAHIQTISTDNLLKMVIWLSGGVLLFCLLFTRILFKKMGFTERLTCFMLLFSVYECLYFDWRGYFTTEGAIGQWVLFFGIILGLYLICIAIYQKHSKKYGKIYTKALKKYQQERMSSNEE